MRPAKATSHAFVGLALAFLVGAQPVLATSAESRFWQSRRAARTAPAPQLAMLPMATPPVDIPTALRSSPGRALRNDLAAESSPLILIEDVHLNAEAQSNIADTVRRLTSTGKIRFVALEGAAGDVDLSIRRRAGDSNALRHATDYLLKTGRISGAVHALLNRSGDDIHVRGVEDDELYRANAAALVRSRALRADTDRALNAVASALNGAEESGLNPELLALVRDLRRDGAASGVSATALALLTDRALKERVSIPGVLVRFVDAAALEKNFDAARIEAERRDLIATLLPKIGEAEKNRLVASAAEFRSGRTSQSDLFDEIRDLARRHGLNLEKWPAMAAHLRYLDLVSSIDAAAVSREARSLQDRVMAAMTTNARERELLLTARWLDAARALTQLSLTSADWSAYRGMDRARVAAAIPAAPLPDLSAYEDFYRLAAQRDAVISAEIERLMSSEKGPGLLVAGAFHADGLERRLAASGRRLVRFAPRLTRVSDDRNGYFSAFAREKTPLESLFAGERVFLATRPAQLGLLPEILILEQEAADPDHSLKNPTALLSSLRGALLKHPVISRDVEPGVAEISSMSGDIRAEIKDEEIENISLAAPLASFVARGWTRARFAVLRGLRLTGILDKRRIPQEIQNGAIIARREAGETGNPFPSVDFDLTLIPGENADLSTIPTLDDIYGPLLEASQAWAESNAPTPYSMDLRRTIDLRRHVITFSGIAKNKANPVAVYAAEAAALRKFFPGYRVDIGSVQGIGAAKGILRNYENISTRRYSFVPGTIEGENDPFVSLQMAVEEAVRGRWPNSTLDPDFELGPYHYSVTATVPYHPHAAAEEKRPGLSERRSDTPPEANGRTGVANGLEEDLFLYILDLFRVLDEEMVIGFGSPALNRLVSDALGPDDAVALNVLSHLQNMITTEPASRETLQSLEVIAAVAQRRPSRISLELATVVSKTARTIGHRFSAEYAVLMTEISANCPQIPQSLGVPAVSRQLTNSRRSENALGELAAYVVSIAIKHPESLSAPVVSDLETLMRSIGRYPETYRAVAGTLELIARTRPDLIDNRSLSRAIINSPTALRSHSWSCWPVLETARFPNGMSDFDRFSIATAAAEALRRAHRPLRPYAGAAVAAIIAARKRDSDRVLVGPDHKFISISHEEDRYFPQRQELIALNAGIPDENIQWFKGPESKGEILSAIASMDGAYAISFHGHGLTEYLQLGDYESLGIKEVGRALIASAKRHGSQTDLSHITLIIDSCHSYDFSEGLIHYLRQRGAVRIPAFVTTAHRHRQSVGSLGTDLIIQAGRKGGALRVKDIFDAERAGAVAKDFTDFAVIAPDSIAIAGIDKPVIAELVAPGTREAAGPEVNEGWLRLVFAPDHEFLQTFRPIQFLRSHQGTPLQQTLRGIGVIAIWLAMLATPAVGAAFMPEALLRVIALGVGYGMISALVFLARIDSGIRIPVEIKISLLPIYLPNVLTHALYNLIVRFAPLTAADRWTPARARATDREIDDLVAEINAASRPNEVHRAEADRLMKMISLFDALGVLPRRGEGTVVNFLDGANRLVGLDRDTLGIDARRSSSMDASIALSLLFHINDERARLEGYRALQADIEHTFIIQQALAGMPQPFVFYLHHVHYFFSWYKRGMQSTQISGMELASILTDHIEKLKPPVIVTTEWTDFHYGEFYDQLLTRLGYRKSLRALLPGNPLEKREESTGVDSRLYSVNPGYNLPLGGQTEVYLHESVVAKTPRRAETDQERIDRELTGLRGLFYYPAGGSDWKPFRDLLPRMPGVTHVISIDREYGNFHTEVPHYKESRAGYLLRQEGFEVEPMSHLSPDRVFIRNSSGQQWSATYIQGDVLSRDVRANLPLNDAAGRSKVAFLHVERPGEFASLTRGEYGPVFHARTISVVMPGGILGGYLRPAAEPLEFLQDHYELLGLERLGEDSNGHLFLKKNAVIDETAMQKIILLDQKLFELWKRLEYPRVAFWTNLTQGELETALVELKAVSPAIHHEVLMKFVDAFRKVNEFHPGTWKFSGERLVGPIGGDGSRPITASIRLVLPTLLLTVVMQAGEAVPFLLALTLATAAIDLVLALPGKPIQKILPRLWPVRPRAPAKRDADLDRRAQILVAAAEALSKPGGAISDSLIDAALANAARSEGLLSAGQAAAMDPLDWTAAMSSKNFTAAIDRAVARARAQGLDPQTARAVVDRLSGWGVPVDARALGGSTIVIPVQELGDLRRVQAFEKRFPDSPILIWANAGVAASIQNQNLSGWPVSIYGDDLFVDSRFHLQNVAANLPRELRATPQDLVFALPSNISVDDTGLAPASEWRNLRILIVDEILGAIRLMTAEQRSVIDRIVEHLVASTQA